MKDKIFISHSSARKVDYVEPLVKCLGRDMVIVDKYNFESGEEIWSEIEKNIEDCKYFVLLISIEALKTGGWVDREISKVGQLVFEEKVKFWPVIIDERVDWNDDNIKTWIKNKYITDKILSPRTLARLLNRKIRKHILESDSLLRKKKDLFMGREKDMSILKGKYSDCRTDSRNIPPTTLFVSGLKHLGRKRFIKEFLTKEVKQVYNTDDIIDLSLSSTDNGWALAQQLNELVGDYTPDQINAMTKDDVVLNEFIVNMMLRLRDSKEVVVIEDDGAIIKRNGFMSEWFKALVLDKRLQKEIFWCVISRFLPRRDINSIFPQVISLKLNEISKEWLIRLFKEYAQIRDCSFDDNSAELYAEMAKGYPKPIYLIVDALKDGNSKLNVYRKVLNSWEFLVSANYSSLLEDIRNEGVDYLPTLQVLAMTPLLSVDNLISICGEKCQDHLDFFESLGLVQYIGRDNSVMFLNSGVGDFVRRKNPVLPDEIQKRFEAFSDNQIENIRGDVDFAGYLHAKRERIKANKGAINEEDLVPSLVLHLITEYYYKNDNDSVIVLADQILKGYKSKYKDMERPLKYWLCSALCRKADRRLLSEIKYFDENSYSYNFLMGFYHRHRKDRDQESLYGYAKEFYTKAYELTARNDSEFDDAKLLHELWIVKYTLNEPDAVDFARKCYERRPTNHYHIEAYFRSEAKSAYPDKALLNKLVEEMKKSDDQHKTIIAKTMEAELNYIGHLDIGRLRIEIGHILDSGIDQEYLAYPMRIFKEICMKRGSMATYKAFKKDYPLINETAAYHVPD